MHIAIDYGNGDVEEFDSSSRQISHLIPKGHGARVELVSSIIGAAMKRRAFFKRLLGLGSDELLDPENSYHEEYRQHLQDLANIPYDGYHTEYSQWALEFGEKQPDSKLASPILESLDKFPSSENYKSYPSLPIGASVYKFDIGGAQPSSDVPIGIAFIKGPDEADSDDAEGSDDKHSRTDDKFFDK